MKRTRFWLVCIISCLLFHLFVLDTESRDVVKYRQIIGEFATLEEAQAFSSQESASEIVSDETNYMVVQGWFDQYREVVNTTKEQLRSRAIRNQPALLQQHLQIDNPKTDWKNVLPVEMEETEAKNRGLNVSLSLFEVGKERHASALGQSRAQQQLIQSSSGFLTLIETKKNQNTLNRTDEISIRKQAEDIWLALTDQSNEPVVQGMARVNLGKLYYEQGLEKSVPRIEQFKGELEPHDDMDAEEETAYDSALEQFSIIAEQFPNSHYAEEACYYKAATLYHLTNRGHPVFQKQKALQAYQDYLNRFPYGDRAVRALLNMQGLTLELARLETAGYHDVIHYGNIIRYNYPQSSGYIRSRAMLMQAETYYEHFQDYQNAVELCRQIIQEFANSEHQSVMGTAHRVMAYSYYEQQEYEKAIQTWNQYIGSYLDGKYNFDYQVETKKADAYYRRGICKERLGRMDDALRDYRIASSQYPNTDHGQAAAALVQALENR